MAAIYEVELKELARLRRSLEALFEGPLVGSDLDPALAHEPWAPPVDVAETQEDFHLAFELPGIARGDIELHFESGRLLLSGTRPGLEGGAHYLRMERRHGLFRREIELGQTVDPDDITARFERGVLSVRVGKRRARRVEVRDAGGG